MGAFFFSFFYSFISRPLYSFFFFYSSLLFSLLFFTSLFFLHPPPPLLPHSYFLLLLLHLLLFLCSFIHSFIHHSLPLPLILFSCRRTTPPTNSYRIETRARCTHPLEDVVSHTPSYPPSLSSSSPSVLRSSSSSSCSPSYSFPYFLSTTLYPFASFSAYLLSSFSPPNQLFRPENNRNSTPHLLPLLPSPFVTATSYLADSFLSQLILQQQKQPATRTSAKVTGKENPAVVNCSQT